MQKVLVAGATGYLGGFIVKELKKQEFWVRALTRNVPKIQSLSEYIVKTLTSVKTYGPLEFFMTVLAVDMVAPQFGKHHLRDFFLESINEM